MERIIIDNAGGITLQLHNWAHFYDHQEGNGIEECANAIVSFVKTGSVENWDGHDEEAAEREPENSDSVVAIDAVIKLASLDGEEFDIWLDQPGNNTLRELCINIRRIMGKESFKIVGWYSEWNRDLQAEVMLHDKYGAYNAIIIADNVFDEKTYKVKEVI